MNRDKNSDILLDSNNEEIDLYLIFNILWRRKLTVFLIIIISTFLSLFNALKTVRTYQGEFQVVIDKNVNNNSNLPSLLSSFNGLRSLTSGINSLGYEIKTQVKVMQSPSVLMDVFKFVEDKKKNDLDKKNFTLRYKRWQKENLKIALEEGTTILNISYKDTDKEIILPVLNKLSKKYREFNVRKEEKKINNTLNFLENQISLYDDISLNSISKMQEYASVHDLSPLIPNREGDKNKFISSNESKRVEFSNKLRFIKEKINLIEKRSDSPTELVLNFALSDNLFRSQNQNVEKLKIVEQDLINLKIIYKEKDPLIKKKEKIKAILHENIKKDYEDYLESQENDLKVKIAALKRPRKVLIEYRKLIEDASRNTSLLVNLENQYMATSLKKAKGYQPYELVTKPTLLPYPVAPNRKMMVLLGMIYGTIGGIFISLVIEKIHDIAYSISQIKSITKIPFKGQLDLKEFDNWDANIKLVSRNLGFDGDSIALYYSAYVDSKVLEKIESGFKKNFPKINFKSTYDQKIALISSSIFLIIPLGLSKIKTIKSLLKQISIYGLKTNGILVIK